MLSTPSHTPPRGLRIPRHARTRLRAAWHRAGAALVLVAYLLVLAGSPIGHGWGLVLHVASSHHAAPEPSPDWEAVFVAANRPPDVAEEPSEVAEPSLTDAEAHAEAHRHGRAHEHHGHQHDRGHSHQHAEPEAEPDATPDPEPSSCPAEASANCHSERAKRVEGSSSSHAEPPSPSHTADPTAPHAHGGRVHTHAPPPEPTPALRVLLLDRHCLFTQPPVPHPYPSARAQSAQCAEGLAQFVGFVETPPPRRRA